MNINRHNYEEFFLLYVDKELTAAEKQAVELFVQQNPDLQEELLLLQQSTLKTGAIVFEEKELLLKDYVLTAELQEKLLLTLDNELDIEAMKPIENLIASDKVVKREWGLLQQTKLAAEDSVVFINKPSLYRKEGGRLVVFPWRRIAVTALLLGFGTWGTIFVLQKNVPINNGNTTTINAAIKKKENNTEAIIPGRQTTAGPVVPAIPGMVKQPPSLGTLSNKKSVSQLPDQENEIVATNNLPGPAFQNFNDDASNKKVGPDVPQETQNDVSAGNAKNNEGIDNETGAKLNPVAKEDIATDDNKTNDDLAAKTSFKETEEVINDNHIFYIKEERLKKTRVGILFSRVKKTISQTTLVNTIKSVGVGNLEFAIQ